MNHRPLVLLLGATGHLGRLIADQLRSSSSIILRVTSRRRSQLPELSQKYGEAVFLDLDDPRTFEEALRGVDRLFLLTGYSVSMVAQSKTIIDAAKKANVKHLVHSGVFSLQWDCTVPHFLWHQLIEVYIKSLGFQWTYLHPNCYLQNLTGFSLIKGGKFRWYVVSDKPCGWVALEDVAEAAAKILVEGPQQHHAKDYWFSTESLTIREMTKLLTEVTGVPFTPDLQTPDQFLKDLGADTKTLDPYFYSVAESCRQIEDGRMSYISDVKDDMWTLFGHPGRTVRQWMEMHRQELIQLAHEPMDEHIDWGTEKRV